jgi:hypothetical protein
VLAFREKGTLSQGIGIVEYVLTHPIDFERDKLVDLVKENIKKREWNPTYSRNLAATELIVPERAVVYTDGSHGTHDEMIYHVLIEKRRNNRAALNTIAILDEVTPTNGLFFRPDTTYLKWAGLSANHRTIFPEDYAKLDALALRTKETGVFLHSLSDEVPRKPIITGPGTYVLTYLRYADSFPPVRFEIKLDHKGTVSGTTAALLD